MAGFLVEPVFTGLLGSLGPGEDVPGRIAGSDTRFPSAAYREPRAFNGDELAIFEETVLRRKSAGEGREDVGLASLTADEHCVPLNSCDAGSNCDRLFRKGF